LSAAKPVKPAKPTQLRVAGAAVKKPAPAAAAAPKPKKVVATANSDEWEEF
jgi:hypothetical protein